MCEPMTIAAIAAAGMQTVGAVQSARAEKANAKNQAYIAQQNANLQEQAATDATRRGATEANAQRQRTKQENASMQAAFGASGVDGNFGSALEMQTNNKMQGELDALVIQNNAEREAYGNRVGAYNSLNERNMQQARGKQASPLMAGATTLMSQAPSVASKWSKYSSAKPSNLPWQAKGNVNPKGGYY